MAKPIIATRVGDIPNILNQSGYFVDPGSPGQIAEKISYLFTHREEAAQKGQLARDRCIAHYSTAKMGEILNQVLRSVVV